MNFIEHFKKEIEHFFTTYKQIQKKEVSIKGFKDKKEAQANFEKSIALYKEKFGTSGGK